MIDKTNAIETFKNWIEYEKVNKNKIHKADELIEIQETVLKELETWKKIAEKLAEKMIYLPFKEDGTFYYTKEAIIEWARNEVEK